MQKRRKIKKAIALLLLIGMGFLLTGCTNGDDTTPNNNTSVVPSDQPITLIWWNLFETQENIQPLIDAYQTLHPNVTIEYAQKDLVDYQSSLDEVLTDNIPESTPDIFTIHNTWMGDMLGILYPLLQKCWIVQCFNRIFIQLLVRI